jgi:hypothetical protein
MTEPPCACEGPGFCPRFGIEQQQYPFEVCRGLHGDGKGERYRRKWRLDLLGESPRPVARTVTGAPATPPRPCAYLGDPTGEVRECGTCSGRVRLKVRACKIHGACTEARKVDGLACCRGPDGRGCPDRVDQGTPGGGTATSAAPAL